MAFNQSSTKKRKLSYELDSTQLFMPRRTSAMPLPSNYDPIPSQFSNEQTSQLYGEQCSPPTSTAESTCSSEHSCCDDPACMSATTVVQKSEACSLEACLNPEQCDQVDCCSDEACIHPACPDARDFSSIGDVSDKSNFCRDEFADFLNYDTIDANGYMPCQWLETDHQCSVSAPPAALSQHVFKDHIEQNALLPCGWAQCDQTVDSQQLLQHVAQTHQPDKYVCLWQGCGYSFSSDEELTAHMSAMHCTKLDCHWGGCEFIHMDPSALKSHVSDEHLNLQPSAVCYPRSYSSSESAPSSAVSIQPISHRSSSSSFDTSFSRHNPLEQSSAQPVPIESSLHNYRCLWTRNDSLESTCSASFAHPNDLQAHLEKAHLSGLSARTHRLGTAVFICRWQGCKANGARHNGKDKLRKHTYTHTGCYFYQCSVCSHKFSLKGPYENHLRIHTGEKPFKCEKCDSTFPSKEALTNHMRTHTGEKHLRCEICGFQCGDSSNLSKHRKTHKPPVNTCSICHKAFCRPDSLKRHMIQHNKPPGQKRGRTAIAGE